MPTTAGNVSQKVLARAKAVPILRKLPVFEGLQEAELLKLMSACSSKAVEKGDEIFKQGEDGSSMYILLAGMVDIVVEGVGVVHIMKPGEILGEMGLVCKITRTASAVAKEKSVLLHLYADILHELVKKNPNIGYIMMKNIAGILAQRIIGSNQKAAPAPEKKSRR